MSSYGVTPSGFIVKPIADILSDTFDRARAVFGPNVDLHSTSALRKMLDVIAIDTHEQWKALEAHYYANFASTASGDALDLLGDDVGVPRAFLKSSGTVSFKLTNGSPGRNYQLPVGTLVETAGPIRFRTTQAVSLTTTAPTADAGAQAVEAGIAGNVAKTTIVAVNAQYAEHYLNLGSATVGVSNAAAFAGGDLAEDDETYRTRLLGKPRTLWTVEAIRDAVINVDGVRDCRVNDPLGGVDSSQSIFNLFVYGRRRFGEQRFFGSPYFFDVLVAPEPGYIWESDGGVTGIRESVENAIANVRPVGIFPNVVMADSVSVGVRADVTIKPGLSSNAIVAALKDKFERRVAGLGLGNAVLASEVLCDFMNVEGALDVQNLRLRRYPPTFSSIKFGDRERFASSVVEVDVGANLPLSPKEIAVFTFDSSLVDLQVTSP